ncbi:MAG: hypothetical protein GEV11_12695 [Streptosporangiales bacterium]|nr:hypothetical protein [Streptosporangiales bacterium]
MRLHGGPVGIVARAVRPGPSLRTAVPACALRARTVRTTTEVLAPRFTRSVRIAAGLIPAIGIAAGIAGAVRIPGVATTVRVA